MRNTILTSKLKCKHQVFTPEKVVNKMIKIAIKNNVNLYTCSILENSCGNGNVLVKIVEELIKDAISNSINCEQIKIFLQNNIHAYEIDKKLILECINRLDSLCNKYGIFNVNWDIKNKDFLMDKNSYTYDIIIGNPPYISYLDLPEDKRIYLKNNYESCSKGKFDYSYAFIEKSYNSLNQNGSLIYLVPSNWFKNVFANKLRQLVINDLTEIIDLQKQKIFEDVLVSTAIIHIKRGSNLNKFKYSCPAKKIRKKVNKSIISDKWIFCKTKEQDKYFKDEFDVFIAIATLNNKVFILSEGYVKDNYYYFDNYKIELGILKSTYSPKDKKYHCNTKKIIFPYTFKNGVLIHYNEEELKRKFPGAYKYLLDNKDKLLKRNSDKNAQWFEYGRSQAIMHMNQKMCIISAIISDETEAYIIGDDEIPYSGICIVPKNNNSVFDALKIINTKNFREYAQTIGVCINGNSKRISPNDIKNYTYL